MSAARRDSVTIGIGTGRNTCQEQTQASHLADAAEPSNPLQAGQPQLAETMQQNQDLIRQCCLLTEKVSPLEIALAKANQFAHYDELTGLPNRRFLLDRFVQAAALANRHRQVFALLFFDLNNFKRVNDKLGHDAGDKLLQQVATRLSGSIRRSDTACRYGGDEFIVLLGAIDSGKDAVKALQKIRAQLAPLYRIDSCSILLTVSRGLAIYPTDAQCMTELLQLADRSMFRNKYGNRRQSGTASQSQIQLHDAGE